MWNQTYLPAILPLRQKEFELIHEEKKRQQIHILPLLYKCMHIFNKTINN